ncbi:hypothetical protein Ahy_B01g052052 [Arachis hypogaea]|uniref:Uncharacterized protein n=1 Tax=Arachis hypogaea TaxID=3818 RepID=A0A445ANF6_ARAHY|nr:hypothetical protein Ahy_B01g052052 [Arachis hypogaea]
MLTDLYTKYKATFCILLETHISGKKAELIIKKFGFDSWCVSEAEGFSGGIWCLWKKDLWNIKPITIHRQLIHLEVQWNREPPWFFTAIYGSPQVGNRNALWDKLEDIANSISGPWCIGGDFNSTLTINDTGGSSNLSLDTYKFQNCSNVCGLKDLGFSGPPFTWQRRNIKRGLTVFSAIFPSLIVFLIHLRTLKAPNASTGEDCVSWAPAADGNFSIRTAYDAFFKGNSENSNIYKQVWKLKIPQRLKSFSWLLTHEALLTNSKRKSRGLTEDSTCPRCHQFEETILHVLRDCPFIRKVWTSIIPRDYQDTFFSQSFHDWLRKNLLEASPSVNGTPWPITFTTTCNLAWKSRNELIFSEDSLPNTQFSRIAVNLADHYHFALNLTEVSTKTLRLTRKESIGWEPPEQGWLKLNVDGSVLHPGSRGACGGIIRNWEGRVVAGFSMKIGKCTITTAEIWGFYVGIKLATEMRISKLVVESDSKCAVELIQKTSVEKHSQSTLIRAIKELLVGLESVVVRHIYREANFCADALAKAGQEQEDGVHCFKLPPAMVAHQVLADRSGMKFSRSVTL